MRQRTLGLALAGALILAAPALAADQASAVLKDADGKEIRSESVV